MRDLLIRAAQVADVDADAREVFGMLVPFNQPAKVRDAGGPAYLEAFAPEAFDDDLSDGTGRPLLRQHNPALPLGGSRSIDVTDDGVAAVWKISETREGDEALALVRDGGLAGFSVGFINRQSTKIDDVVVRTKAAILEGSLVPIPSYPDATVAGYRAWTTVSVTDAAAGRQTDGIGASTETPDQALRVARWRRIPNRRIPSEGPRRHRRG